MNAYLCVNVNDKEEIVNILLVNFDKKITYSGSENILDSFDNDGDGFDNFYTLDGINNYFTYVFKIKDEKQYENFLQIKYSNFKNKNIKLFLEKHNLYEWML